MASLKCLSEPSGFHIWDSRYIAKGRNLLLLRFLPYQKWKGYVVVVVVVVVVGSYDNYILPECPKASLN